jgi:hypothetical protein
VQLIIEPLRFDGRVITNTSEKRGQTDTSIIISQRVNINLHAAKQKVEGKKH